MRNMYSRFWSLSCCGTEFGRGSGSVQHRCGKDRLQRRLPGGRDFARKGGRSNPEALLQGCAMPSARGSTPLR